MFPVRVTRRAAHARATGAQRASGAAGASGPAQFFRRRMQRRRRLRPAVGLLVLLMLGALAMHVKVNDPPIKSLPAALMLLMSGTLLSLSL